MVSKGKKLKIKGKSIEDIIIISGLVQDSLIAPSEMTFEYDQQRFVAILNRFMWERESPDLSGGSVTVPEENDANDDARFEDASGGRFWRVQSALIIEKAKRTKQKNLETIKNEGTLAGENYLSLLGMVPDEGVITLYFAGGGLLRTEGSSLAVFLEDLSEPWPTTQMPDHRLNSPQGGRLTD